MKFANDSASTTNPSEFSETFPVCKLLNVLFDSMMISRVALIITALTSPFAVFLNGLTLFAFYKNPSLRKPANVFLIGLVIADFIKSAVASPLIIIMHALYQNKGQTSCFLIVIFSNTTLYLPSLFLLASLNIIRFISIKAPFWHRAHVTKSIVVKTAVAGCVFSMTITIGGGITKPLIYPMFATLFGLLISTLVPTILIWRELKKRRYQVETAHDEHKLSIDEASSSHQKQANFPLEVQVVVKKDGRENPEKIETLGEADEHEQPKDKNEKARNMTITPSPLYLIAMKSEKKAAKVAACLTTGLAITGMIPALMFAFHVINFGPSAIGFVPMFFLLSSLVNPIIHIGMNYSIRQACFKLVNCC